MDGSDARGGRRRRGGKRRRPDRQLSQRSRQNRARDLRMRGARVMCRAEERARPSLPLLGNRHAGDRCGRHRPREDRQYHPLGIGNRGARRRHVRSVRRPAQRSRSHLAMPPSKRGSPGKAATPGSAFSDFGDEQTQTENAQGIGRSYLFLTPTLGGANMRCAYLKAGSTETIVNSVKSLPTGTMSHVAVVADDQNNKLAIYLNGSLDVRGHLERFAVVPSTTSTSGSDARIRGRSRARRHLPRVSHLQRRLSPPRSSPSAQGGPHRRLELIQPIP